MISLTDEQRELFTQLVNANWDFGQALDRGDHQTALHHQERVKTIKARLIGSMGEEAFDKFMEQGKKMFNS